jgi:hypothetical protein
MFVEFNELQGRRVCAELLPENGLVSGSLAVFYAAGAAIGGSLVGSHGPRRSGPGKPRILADFPPTDGKT